MMRKSGGRVDRERPKELYRKLTPGGFSDQVLSLRAERLCVLPMAGAEWSDLGTQERVLRSMTRDGVPDEPLARRRTVSELMALPGY